MGIRGQRGGPWVSWQSVGNLNNGANDGLWYVNANNALTNTNWTIASRLSGCTSRTFGHVYPARARA